MRNGKPLQPGSADARSEAFFLSQKADYRCFTIKGRDQTAGENMMKKFNFLSDRQQRIMVIFFAVLITMTTLLFVATSQASPATISGEWTAQLSTKKADHVQISFSRRTERGGFNNNGQTFGLGELQGLTIAGISSARADVAFSIARDAGTFTCEGYFREGRGVGFWTFTPSQSFAAAMRSRGYTALTDEEMLSAAFHNLTVKYVDELKSAGYDSLDFKQLSRAAGHGITTAYIRELGSAGYATLKMDELIRASNHDINASYIRDVRAMGFDKQPLEQLIRLQNHDITPEFISQMKAAGFENLSPQTYIRLKNHDITAEFVNEIKAEGYTEVPAETAVRLKNHDVDAGFIRRAKAQGYVNTSLDELIRLRNRGVIK
jgi:hypothetical protein